MKKIITSCLVCGLLGITANAEENNMYIGLDVINSSNTFKVESQNQSTDTDDDSKGFKFKLGYEIKEGIRIQLYYLNETYNKTVFDSKNDELNEIGIDLVKEFKTKSKFSPFILGGLGYGWMNLDGYSDKEIDAISLKIGAGLMYQITSYVELVGGIDFQYRSWQDVRFNGVTREISEESRKIYAGINYKF